MPDFTTTGGLGYTDALATEVPTDRLIRSTTLSSLALIMLHENLEGLGFRVLGFRVWGSGFRVSGLGLKLAATSAVFMNVWSLPAMF